MKSTLIGTLVRVQLREVWKHEAHNFTQWLENNISVLNDALDINLINVDREQAAGSFSIDLVAKDDVGNTVIIENQLEKSNHDHLGKLLTYLTAMNAKSAIWIVSEPRPEHVAVINWLNESRSASFYMVKVEAVRIGDSPPAPLFTLIVGPSGEAQSIGDEKKEIAERYTLRKRWWTLLIKRPANKLHAHIKPGEYSWLGTSAGISGLNWVYVVGQDNCAVELYIDRGKNLDEENKFIFDQLKVHEFEIEKAFGHRLRWERLEGKRACRIKFQQNDGGYRNKESEWPHIQDEIVSKMNRFENTLQQYIQLVIPK